MATPSDSLIVKIAVDSADAKRQLDQVRGQFDQFGTSGCVGCGRCITWCPVGIDITAEAAAIRAKQEVV